MKWSRCIYCFPNSIISYVFLFFSLFLIYNSGFWLKRSLITHNTTMEEVNGRWIKSSARNIFSGKLGHLVIDEWWLKAI